ncbi:MAG TPA: DUF1127 domain-containing protein [Kiloniellales bacterium]
MHTIWTRPRLAGPADTVRRLGPLFSGSVDAAVLRAANLLLTWQERAAERHALASLETRMLRDIGLSRADALREAAKPFWRA